MAVSKVASAQQIAQQTLQFLNRQNYSFPPDHGARVVTTILSDPELRADWESELELTRKEMHSLRQQLADELAQLTGSVRFNFLADHRGMFSCLGTTPELVKKLQYAHGVYMVSDSRMNIAGLNTKTVPILAKAIVGVGI
jgi:aromatic-amino-acid transaminase